MKKWKKVLAGICTAAMLMTVPGMGVLADELDATLPVVELDAASSADEETVGNGDIVVGDGVTATFDEETGAVEFYSSDGTLWTDWVNKAGLDKAAIKSIKVASGKVYLPEDSSGYDDNNKFHMFGYMYNLTSLDLSGFDTSNVTDMKGMFYNCSKLTSLDLSGFDTSNVTNMAHMFGQCSSLTSLDLSEFDTSNVTDMQEIFRNCRNVTSLDVSSFETTNVENMKGMFFGCLNLESLDVSGFDTSKVTTMETMFYFCQTLPSLDVSDFDTSNVTNMVEMFSNCRSLASLDVSDFDTSNVTEMKKIFRNCYELTNLNVSGFDTSNVEDMGELFSGCSSLATLDISSFDTSKVIDMGFMFMECSGLTSLDLGGFDTSHLMAMDGMFIDCSSLTSLDLSSFDTSEVLFMDSVFSGCSSLISLDMSSFDMSSVMYGDDMFDGCSALQELKTPKECAESVGLPAAMYDEAGNEYEELPALSESIVLTREKPDISNCEITLSEESYIYDGKAKEPAVTVKSGNTTLTAGTHYTVTYADNTSAGTATVKVEGIGGFKGEKTVTFKINKPAPTPTPKPAAKGFSDVQDPKHAYYKAIYWAAEAGITKGYPDGTFGINKSCTRGEMMMFLWRYAGKPNPKNVSKSPFKDVKTNHAFYKAILWGSQKGITKGYSDGTFGINKNVSRGECMMFLWRLKGKPAPKAVAKSPFTDVPKNHVFYNAILWGAQKKITTGYTSGANKGKFMVNQNCSRGQIVTFLYRAK